MTKKQILAVKNLLGEMFCGATKYTGMKDFWKSVDIHGRENIGTFVRKIKKILATPNLK